MILTFNNHEKRQKLRHKVALKLVSLLKLTTFKNNPRPRIIPAFQKYPQLKDLQKSNTRGSNIRKYGIFQFGRFWMKLSGLPHVALKSNITIIKAERNKI